MPSLPPFSRALHRFALITAAATFLLVIAGGLVWATESALACPDWPLCHGQAFPQLTGRVLFEVGHRYMAATVATLTTVLAVWMVVRPGPRRWVGLVALALVLVQAVLGGLTVRWNLPFVIRVAHLAASQAFFGSVLWAVFATRKPQGLDVPFGTRALAGVAAASVYVQLLLGAFVRHTGAALACNASVFLCNGALWPPVDGFGSIGPAQVVTLHKAFALVAGTLVVAAALRTLRGGVTGIPRRLAFAAIALVAVQIGLGALSVLTYLGVVVVTAHLAVGSLLFGTALSLALSLAKDPVRSESPVAEALSASALGAR